MKEFIFEQAGSQLGLVKGVCRIIGKFIYFKFNNNQYSAGVLSQMRQRGAEIEIANGWIRIDIFTDKEIVKLGDKEFNVKETKDKEIEQILYDFYKLKYAEAKFTIKEL